MPRNLGVLILFALLDALVARVTEHYRFVAVLVGEYLAGALELTSVIGRHVVRHAEQVGARVLEASRLVRMLTRMPSSCTRSRASSWLPSRLVA